LQLYVSKVPVDLLMSEPPISNDEFLAPNDHDLEEKRVGWDSRPHRRAEFESHFGSLAEWEVAAPAKRLSSFSVVLPCAQEGELMVNTARSVFEFTPASVLHEIVIVDDGSNPPLEPMLPDKDRLKVKFVRHDNTEGLIRAKKSGGDFATGDIVVFLDCHVKPDPNWWRTIQAEIADNYKRVVVPTITSLNVDTWTEFNRPAPGQGGLTKCYLTWDIEFKWFGDDTKDVPVMSGGLLAMSNRWWRETGGYDMVMHGWGGENIDQSLRIWLCGGEIVFAKDSYVAHMWRMSNQPKTRAKYHVPPGSSQKNRQRAAKAWFGGLYNKTLQFPEFGQFRGAGQSGLGSLDNYDDIKSRMECKPFVWFLDRFPQIYHWGGLIPPTVFMLREVDSGMCVTRPGGRWGNAAAPTGTTRLAPCDRDDPVQWFHGANQKQGQKQCCSGIRSWNSDQCLQKQGDGLETGVCTMDGSSGSQLFEVANGKLMWAGGSRCAGRAAGASDTVEVVNFGSCSDGGWRAEASGNGVVLRHTRTGQCMARVDDRPETADCNPGASNQIWRLITIRDGLSLVKADNGQCFDAASGTKLIVYPCADDGSNNNQLFTLENDLLKWGGARCVNIVKEFLDPSAGGIPVVSCSQAAHFEKFNEEQSLEYELYLKEKEEKKDVLSRLAQ